ncbi:voltage-dependent calcium channel subunit alpha-2/delta-3 isoform X2 [Chironomus tepperi]|uniref:voltage-dependent calcium channel subunit alpha-2/delta-3 isoform X2 n=1 Tax=Chironomus tepperi TaxID=113505 RepID=UPI00391FAF16
MCRLNFSTIVLLYLIQSTFICADESKIIRYQTAQQWAEKFGVELFNFGEFITRKEHVLQSYKQAQIVNRSGVTIVEDIAKEIKKMMDARISAIKRIVDTAQEIGSISASSDEVVERNFTYYNSKEMIEPSEVSLNESPTISDGEEVLDKLDAPKPVIYLTENEKFSDYINLSVSSVHVPTNVYDRAKNVIKAIKWSEMLDKIFDNNYKTDNSLFWQYFCSSTGFLRQFPATKWKFDPVDLYDCRMRHWYIGAANSQKDVVILIDNSGSMTGQKKDIARHIVENILDTLTPNDFVNIFTFSNEIRDVIECFGDTLVQANSANIRIMKEALHHIETNELANFSAAFTRAFDTLTEYRDSRDGANCNQAIMLISDGLPIPVDDVFEVYNWKDKPMIPVRVFTYLIGREVPDVTNIKNMACDNRGYYVHLSTLAEVREQVLQYIPVMARPLVLNRTDHPIVWSQIYADVIDPQLTDYEWECRERASQRDRFMVYRKNRSFHNLPEDPSTLSYDMIESDDSDVTKKFNFMTTVSIPIYDKRENATRIANLLGVAGTDIPISDIKELLQPFSLGVGGYAFIVDNNGLILTHPDFRPVFYKDILKPAYNSVDMIDVELVNDDREPRDYDPVLLELREQIINQSTGSKVLNMKFHFDKMRRVSRMKRHYYWVGIEETPFTLVISLPEEYGKFSIQPRSEDDIHREIVKGTNMHSFFNGSNWKVHPDWYYCKQNNESFSSPEAELIYFIEKMKQPGWKWPLNRSKPPPEHTNVSNTAKDSYYCDRGLIQSLVYDAKVTDWFPKDSTFGSNEKEDELKQRFGISVSFLATHSGLLRWYDHNEKKGEDVRPENEFSETNKKTIDETWYKRAVEQHFIDPKSFVYAVPFDAANRNDTLVTATHAVFHTESEHRMAPVAVVGFQFQHTAMYGFFKNITGSCPVTDPSCASCFSDEFECFVIDDNGYVIISDDIADTGRFFGEIRGAAMRKLIDNKVYQPVKIYDYQAICFINKDSASLASKLVAPFKYIWTLFKIITTHLIWLYLSVLVDNVQAYGSYSYNEGMAYGDPDDYPPDPTERYDAPASKSKEQEFDRRVLINRTRPERCDKMFTLYQYIRPKGKERSFYEYPMSGCNRPYMVLPIPSSNLILFIGSTLCDRVEDHVPLMNQPVMKEYNDSLHCHKLRTSPPYRRQLNHCFNIHLNESQIELCGKASKFQLSLYTLILAVIVAIRSLVV